MDRRRLKIGRGLVIPRTVKPSVSSQRSTVNQYVSPAAPEPEDTRERSPILSRSTPTPRKRCSDPKPSQQKRTQSSERASQILNVLKRPRIDEEESSSQVSKKRLHKHKDSTRRSECTESFVEPTKKSAPKRTSKTTDGSDDETLSSIDENERISKKSSTERKSISRKNISPELSPVKIRTDAERREIVMEATTPETPKRSSGGRFSLRSTPSPRKETPETPKNSSGGRFSLRSTPSPRKETPETPKRSSGGRFSLRSTPSPRKETPETPKRSSGGRFSLRLTPSPRKETPETPVRTRASHLKKKDASSESLKFSDNDDLSPERPTRSGIPKSKSPKKNILRNNLGELFCTAGIVLAADDSPHQLAEDVPTVVQNLENLMKSPNKYKEEEILEQWRRYISKTEYLQRALNDMQFATDQEVFTDFNKKTLVKILLHVPSLQKGVIASLLDQLTEAVLEANSPDDVPWSSLMLQQLRFLEEIVDEVGLAAKLEELLDVSPTWLQRELIPCLTQIITETQHHALAEMLVKMLEEKPELTAAILECVSNLSLSKEYLEELRGKVLRGLRSILELSCIPATARFLLLDCNTQEVRVETLKALRSVDMKPLVSEKPEDCYTNQVLMVTELRMAILRSKVMADAALLVVQGIKKDPNPLDLVLLLQTYSTGPVKKKNVEGILRKRVRSGFFGANLLTAFYKDYKEVARELQSTCISLASQLLKAPDRVFVDFAVEWFRQLFISQAQVIHKQREILEKIILLMGTDEKTAKNALSILSKMAAQQEEQKYLQAHCNHLRILLEKVDDLCLEEVATLSDLLHGLCASSSSTSDALQDDLNILLHKQLSHSKPLTKCKGVLEAVMAIKHLAVKPETCENALNLFRQVMTAVKRYSRSRALFYDRMAEVIDSTKTIQEVVLKKLIDHITEDLMDSYLVESASEYRDELTPQFGLNTAEEQGEEETIISFGDSKDGAVLPVLFKFLRICSLRLDGNLQEIDSLLGCRILMPKNLHDPDFKVVDLIFHCVNWYREVISGFVRQDSPALQEKLLRRLDNLMELQGDLVVALALVGNEYHPPECYFEHFPKPPFVRVEKKTTRKGKKATLEKTFGDLAEWESWEMGSNLSCKNPAYFRRFDAEVAHLLGFNMDVRPSQLSKRTISIAQVCFLIKELLGMLENEASPNFIRDLVHLLPKVCTKLEQVADELREKDEAQNREGAKLLLNLLAAIFNWKGFQNAVHYSMLRESLRVVASQSDPKNKHLCSCKELVAESFGYFESLAEIATRISLAVALINVSQALVQHSKKWAPEYKEKLAKMAFGFLCLEWPDDKSVGLQYKSAVGVFLKSWIRNEPDPLKTVVTVLEWLPEESERLEKQLDSLIRLPSVNRNNFNLLLKEIFIGLIEGVKISLALPDNRDPDRIRVWQSVATGVQKIVQVCKSRKVKADRLLFLQRMPHLLKLFIVMGMPVLECNLKYQMEEVTGIVKLMQEGTRYLHTLCCDSRKSKDTVLTKYVPIAKSTLERLVYRVKGMLVLNNSPMAFWMGNLRNKDLEGKEIFSQSTTSGELSSTTTNETSESRDVSDDLLSDDLSTDQEEEDDEFEC